MEWEEALRVVWAALASVGGAGVIIWGVSTWLGKVWAGRILEQDRLRYGKEIEALRAEFDETARKVQAELDRVVHVSRAQNDAEFTALQGIWARVASVREEGLIYSKLGGPLPAAEIESKIEVFRVVCDGLRTAVDKKAPFYTADLRGLLDALINHCHLELSRLRTDRPDSPASSSSNRDFFDRRDDAYEEVKALVETIEEAIRARLADLRVVE